MMQMIKNQEIEAIILKNTILSVRIPEIKILMFSNSKDSNPQKIMLEKRSSKNYIIFVDLGLATPGTTQGLILVLHSEITTGKAQGTTWGTGNQSWVSYVQNKHNTSYTIFPTQHNLPLFCEKFLSLLKGYVL